MKLRLWIIRLELWWLLQKMRCAQAWRAVGRFGR